MIKNEDMNIMIQYEQANQDVFTLEQMEMFYAYFKQQEKKDELLELYRELVYTRNKDDYNNKWDKIKALEEEIK